MQKDSQMTKEASGLGGLAKVLKGLGVAGTTAGTPLGMDYAMNAGTDPDFKFGISTIKDLINGNMTPQRKVNFFINAGLGGLGGGLASKGKVTEGVSTLVMAPVKDLATAAIGTTGKANKALDAVTEASGKATEDLSKTKWILGGLGAGALGLGAIGLAKYLSQKDPKTEMGKLKLKLPGKEGEPDTDAEVELPIDLPGMSDTLMSGLNMGVRRQARKNVKANSFKRDLKTGKLIPLEVWEEKYGDPRLIRKEASSGTRPISLVEGVMREVMPEMFIKSSGIAGAIHPGLTGQGAGSSLAVATWNGNASSSQPSQQPADQQAGTLPIANALGKLPYFSGLFGSRDGKYSHTGGAGWIENPEYNMMRSRMWQGIAGPPDAIKYKYMRDPNWQEPATPAQPLPAVKAPANPPVQQQPAAQAPANQPAQPTADASMNAWGRFRASVPNQWLSPMYKASYAAPAPAPAPAPMPAPMPPPPPPIPGGVAARRPVMGTNPTQPKARDFPTTEQSVRNTRKTVDKVRHLINKNHIFDGHR